MRTSIIKMDRESGLQHRGIKQTVRGDAAAAEREATKSKTSLPNIDQIRSKNRQQPARAQQCSLRLGQILVVYALLFHAIFQLFYFGSIGATEADQINQSGPGLADQGGTQRHERSGKSVDDKCNPKNFLVLIKAGAKAKYQQRRKLWRESSCPALYKNSNVSYRFMLAMPAHEIIDPNAHAQGARASEKEISDMIMLESESLEHNDMVFLPLKDIYNEFSIKVISMLHWAADRGMNDETSVVVLHDDEYCLRPEVMQAVCKDAMKSGSSLYAGGEHIWNTRTEFTTALDGTFAPYFNGALYALSADLIRDIAYDSGSLFANKIMIYAEDALIGHLVKKRVDRKMKIKYVREPFLMWEVEKGENSTGRELWEEECPASPKGIDVSKRLELLHITKTGGTFLEILAAKHGVSWGACHFLSRVDDMPLDLSCPGASLIPGTESGGYGPTLRNFTSSLNGISLWHAPPKYLKEDEAWWLEDSNQFTVVRDPYSRAVSAYNYISSVYNPEKSQDADAMNAWLNTTLNEIYSSRPTSAGGADWKSGYFRGESSVLVPQTEYVDENVRVLRMEFLERDFMCMLKDHGLLWEWTSERRNKSEPGHLTVANINASNLRLIETVYRQDFLKLGYPMQVQMSRRHRVLV